MNTELFDYPKQDASGATCIAQAWAKTPKPLETEEKKQVIQAIKSELTRQNAVLVAHYYVDGDIQDLAWGNGWLCG